jgi:hypothetical protein
MCNWMYQSHFIELLWQQEIENIRLLSILFLLFCIFLFSFDLWFGFASPCLQNSNANANDGTKIELNRLKTTIMKVLIATFQIIWFFLLYFAVQIFFLVHISVGLFAKKNVWKMYEKLQLSFDIFIIIPQLIIFFGCFLLLSIDVNALL